MKHQFGFPVPESFDELRDLSPQVYVDRVQELPVFLRRKLVARAREMSDELVSMAGSLDDSATREKFKDTVEKQLGIELDDDEVRDAYRVARRIAGAVARLH